MTTLFKIYITGQIALLKGLIKNPKFWIILGIDVVLLILAHFLSYYVRFESIFDEKNQTAFITLIPLLIFVKIPVFYVNQVAAQTELIFEGG